jgi:hypothetical protein
VALHTLLGSGGLTAVLATPEPASEDQVERAVQVVETCVLGDGAVRRSFSVEELAVLAEYGGTRHFPGTGDYEIASPEVRAAARRSLLARGTILAVDDGGGAYVKPADARLVATALYPEVVVSVEHRHGGADARLLLYVASSVSVAHGAAPEGVHRLEMLPTGLVGTAVALFTRLRDQDPATAEAMTVSRPAFAALRAEAEGGRPGETTNGAEEQLRKVFASVASSTHVRVAPSNGQVAAPGEVIWFDCGDQGLWLVTPEHDEVMVRPVALAELSERFTLLWRGRTTEAEETTNGESASRR